MFYGSYITQSGEIVGGFYSDYDQWFKDTFPPDTQVSIIIDLHVHGKTYAERKDDVRNKAIDFQRLFEFNVPMAWSELAEWGDYFSTQGKRFGLLSEFRENGIL